MVRNGTVRLFSDDTCATSASDAVSVSSGTASITTSALSAGSHQFYVQHTDSNDFKGNCVGSVGYSMETLTLARSSPSISWGSDTTPTFNVIGLVVHSGTIQLFSEATCTTTAGNRVTVTSTTASVTANALSAGNHQFYIQHTDTNKNQGDCFGPVAYSMEALTLMPTSPSISWGSDSTPTFSVSGLLVHNGTIRLFSDTTCAAVVSSTVSVSSATASITSNALTDGNHQFYVQHTDSSSNKGGCFGPVAYAMETLTLAMTSPDTSLGTDSTPTLSVTGLVVQNGTVQLFRDAICTTSASGTVAVSSATASITANVLTDGNHQFYVRHTDSSNNQGDCFGPVDYSMETLSLVLSSSNTFLDSDSTPTLSVTGLVIHNGTVQLFSDASCSVPVSATVTVSSATASITSNALTDGNHQFYVQHTDSSSNKGGCFGPVAYAMETLTLALTDSDDPWGHGSTPIFSVTGFVITDGVTQLFSNLDCTTNRQRCRPLFSSTSASITANTVTPGNHDFYVQHTDSSSNEGDCFGPVSYEYHKVATAISMGGSHACAILDDNSLKCWGRNEYGQLGDGTTTNRHTPTAINLGSGRTAKAVSAGAHHTCAILDDDTIKCWGRNNDYQLGNGVGSDQHTPTSVVLHGPTAKAISAGDRRTCIIRKEEDSDTSNNTVVCWGVDHDVLSSNWNSHAKMVSVGINATCIINMDDTIGCQGGPG